MIAGFATGDEPAEGVALSLGGRLEEVWGARLRLIRAPGLVVARLERETSWPGSVVDDGRQLMVLGEGVRPAALASAGPRYGFGDWLWPSAGELCRSLDGVFSGLLFDRVRGRLDLFTDRHGIAPLYLLHRPEGLYFASAVHALLGLRGQRFTLDWAAWAEYLTFQHFLGDRTPLLEVRRLGQGEVATFDCRTGSLRRSTAFSYSGSSLGVQPGPKLEGLLAERLRRAVDRACEEVPHLELLLSGGLDTRALVLALPDRKLLRRAWTTDPDTGWNTDWAVAAELAGRLGVEHRFVPLEDDYLSRHHRFRCLRTDFATSLHSWLVPLSQALPGQGVTFDGLTGDLCWFASHFDEPVRSRWDAGDSSERLELAWETQRVGRGANLLVDPWRKLLLSLARRGLEEELRPHVDHPWGLSLFRLRNRTRRALAAAPLGLLRPTIEIRFPFLDHELSEMALQVSPGAKAGGALYRAALGRLDPVLSGLPSTRDRDRTDRAYFRRSPAKKMSSETEVWLRQAVLALRQRAPFLLLDVAEWDGILAVARREGRLLQTLLPLADLAAWLDEYGDRVEMDETLA